MTAIYFPLAALLIDFLILIMFFIKKTVQNKETKLYSILLIVNFLECLFDIIGIGYIKNGGNMDVFSFLQKIDMVMIVMWAGIMFNYVYMVSFEEKRNHILQKILLYFTIVVSIIICILPNKPIVTETTLDSSGLSPDFAYSTIIIFALGIITSVIISVKRDTKNLKNKKYIPFYSLILLAILGIVLRQFLPQLVVEPFIMGYVVLIMYHTIENPDLQMLREMEMARNQAERANNAKSDFLSSMSHEIRTPLNAIVGLSEDIASFESEVPLQVVEDSEDIRSASQTLLEIVGNILDINKIESGKLEITNEVYRPREIIETIAKINSTRIGEKPIDFKMSIAEDLPYEVIGDKLHIKQILNNLLSNAFKYTEQGEVLLNVKCINKDNICNLIISVQDSGRGIKAEDITKLFTKFERLDVEKNTTTEGTGLGLAITKSLVEMMGGKINVQSQFGKGSIFVVNIPQTIKSITNPITDTQAVRLSEIRKAALATANYGDKRVLIVDDNKLNIKVARRALDDFHFNIDECYDGVECLQKVVNGNEYDLILMDIMMPNMSGETAIQKLKENPNFNIPTIALTADAVAGAKEKYISEGFADYIAKPFSKNQIKEKLDEVFKASNQVKSLFDDSVEKELLDMSKPLSEIKID